MKESLFSKMLFESGGILPPVFALADEICATASGRARRGVEGASGGGRVCKQANVEMAAGRSAPKLSRSTTRPQKAKANGAMANQQGGASVGVLLGHVSAPNS